jgi:hypothetical protein
MPGNPFTDDNWATEITDTVERVVGKVRSAATDNAVKASRGVVFGVLALITALIAIPLVVILAVNLFQAVLDIFVDHHRAVWISYVAMGAVLMISGFFALRMRHGKDVA